MDVIGRSLLIFGVLLVAAGGLVLLASRLPFLGRLPGDLFFQRDGVSFYLPLATIVVVSIVLTLVANILIRLFGK
jgi:hypothetical protein